MKIFLVGSGGQVGNEIKKLYDSNIFELVSFSKKDLDITNLTKVKLLLEHQKPDILINAAAYTDVQQAENNEALSNEVNHLAIMNLVNLCNELRILLIHISTDYVFDGKTNIPYKENDKPNPLNVYGKTKRKGEEKIINSSKLYIILRTSWVFSDSPNNFYTKIKKKLMSEKKIKVVDDQHGCPTSAYSIANCILLISNYYLINNNIKSGIYHFCSQPVTSWYLFASEILNKLKTSNQSLKQKKIIPIKSLYQSNGLTRPFYSALNCQKIKSVFNIDQPNWNDDLEKLNLDYSSNG